MGKEALLNALALLQGEESVDEVAGRIQDVCEALGDITRKRWRFLEDAFSVVLRRVWAFVPADDEDAEMPDAGKVGADRRRRLSPTEATELCLSFVESLLHTSVQLADASDDAQDAANQRGVLVAVLLHLFAKENTSSGRFPVHLRSRLTTDVLACGVEVRVILATLRFREELVACRRALLPSHESDSESDSDADPDPDDDDHDHDGADFEAEDTQWIAQQVAQTWGLTRFRYFLLNSGQEYAFAAWSYHGVGNFVCQLLGDGEQKPQALSAIVSPFSWLFHVAAYAHYMVHSEDFEMRFRGLQMLQAAIQLCPDRKLSCPSSSKRGNDNMCDVDAVSFQEHANAFHNRDWISPLIQVITNAMVSFPEAAERSATLAALRALVSKIVVTDRQVAVLFKFWMLKALALQCPYANVAAVLVDCVRADTVYAWSSSEQDPESPFKTTAIAEMVRAVLAQAAERDLVLHADLLASCLSLFRFLYIRDKENVTGVRTKMADDSIWSVLLRVQKRLQLKMEETTAGHSFPVHGGGGEALSMRDDFTHLMILEAALGSTLSSCT